MSRSSMHTRPSGYIEVITRPKKVYKVRSSGVGGSIDAAIRDKVYVTKTETKRIYKNVIVISIAMMLQYVAYNGTFNLQSTIHADTGLGTLGLCMVYFSVAISSILLPTLVIRKLKTKLTLVLTIACYVPYIVSQVVPNYFTILPSSVLLGLAGAPMWAAQATYLTQAGQVYAVITEENVDVVIVRFFGIFFFIWQNADTFGNLISSIVLGNGGAVISKVGDDNTTHIADLQCGAKFCEMESDIKLPSKDKVFLLILIYVPCVIVAVIVVAVFLDPLTRYGEGRRGAYANEGRVSQLILATLRQFKRANQQMLIPITIYIGMEQAYMGADFTEAFIACTIGVERIGFVMVAWGIGDSLSCILFGFLMKYIGRALIIMIGAGLNICLIGFKLYWRPTSDNEAVFYIIAALWGVADAIWVTQINGLYGLLFRRNKEAAFASYRFFEAIGFMIAFIISELLCIRPKLMILYLTLCIGLMGYLTVEVLYQNKQGNYRNLELYEKLARELKTEQGRHEAHMQALGLNDQIKETAERSDGEDDALDEDIIVSTPR